MLLLLSLACDLTGASEPLILVDRTFVDTGAPDTDTDDTGTDTTGTGTGTGTDTGTAADPWIVISDPDSTDEDGDGRWEPGEWLTVQVTMENMRADDYMAAPGVLIGTDHPDVIIPEPGGNWFYGIFGLDREDLPIRVQADAGIAEGEQVTFTLTLTSLGCDSDPALCLGGQQLTYRRTIGQ